MKTPQNQAGQLLNINSMIDKTQCFEVVHALRWPDHVCCPHCASQTVVKNGHDETQPERQQYCCRSCKRYFDDVDAFAPLSNRTFPRSDKVFLKAI